MSQSPGTLDLRQPMYLASNLFRIDHVTALAVLPVHDGHLKGAIGLQPVATSLMVYYEKLFNMRKTTVILCLDIVII